jgi:hypothetical protein
MRLLHIKNDGSLSLEELFEDDIKPYAILSHTWGPDSEEVNYRDMIDDIRYQKQGYRKIRYCAQQALEDGLRYFWVDTCCRSVQL